MFKQNLIDNTEWKSETSSLNCSQLKEITM